MNNKDLELLIRGFAQQREQTEKDMAQIAGAIVAANESAKATVTASLAKLIKAVRSVQPPVVPPLPGLDVAKLSKLFEIPRKKDDR